MDDWKTNSAKLNRMIVQDAAKEFDPTSQIGFGIDGGPEERAKDFESVRGTLEGNSFVRDLEDSCGDIEKTAADLTALLESLGS